MLPPSANDPVAATSVPELPPPEPLSNKEPSVEKPAPNADLPATVPPPKMAAAEANLAPVGKATMQPVTVRIEQQDGHPATVDDVQIEGLKPGKYQLQVADASSCGPNGAAIGNSGSPIGVTVEVTKDAPAKLSAAEVSVQLDGDQSIVGKTLVIREDKGGAPGDIAACGTISKLDVTADPTAKPSNNGPG